MSRTVDPTRRLLPMLALAVALLSTGAIAGAAPTSASWESAEVSLNVADSHGPMLVVSATLAEGTPLPAQVRLPIPAGSQVHWVGEILGGDPQADPTAAYEASDAGAGTTILTLTLTKSLTAQAEMSPPAGYVTSDPSTARLLWTPVDPVGALRMGVLMPQGSTVSSATQGAAATPTEGMVAYAREHSNPPVGTPIELAVEYTAPAVAALPPATGTSQTPPLAWLAILAGAGLIAALLWPKNRGVASEDLEADTLDASTSQPAPTKKVDPAADGARDDADDAPAPRRGIRPQHAVVLVIAAVLIGLAYFASAGQPGTVTHSDDRITKIVSRADGDAQVSFSIVSLEGSDLDHESAHMFEAVEGIPGVAEVTIMKATLQMVIDYDSSVVTPEAIEAGLVQAGYLSPASAPATQTQ